MGTYYWHPTLRRLPQTQCCRVVVIGIVAHAVKNANYICETIWFIIKEFEKAVIKTQYWRKHIGRIPYDSKWDPTNPVTESVCFIDAMMIAWLYVQQLLTPEVPGVRVDVGVQSNLFNIYLDMQSNSFQEIINFFKNILVTNEVWEIS